MAKLACSGCGFVLTAVIVVGLAVWVSLAVPR